MGYYSYSANKEDRWIFYKRVLWLIIPLSLQNLINVGNSMADVFMLGRVGEVELAAANIAGQVQYIMMMIFFGITSGAGSLAAQYWGKQDLKAIERVLGIALTMSMGVSVLFSALAIFCPEFLMGIYIKDTKVIEAGGQYLRIVGFSYLCLGITMIYLNTMRSIEKVFVSTVIYLSSLVTNVLLNAVLIFGLFGMEPMGIKGAAYASLSARILELIFVIIYDKKVNKKVNMHLSDLWVKDKLLLKDFLTFSLPVVANEFLWGLGTTFNIGILGNYNFHGADPAAVIAASSVVQMVRQLATVVAFGIATSAAIVVGKTLGENRLEDAKVHALRMAKLAVAAGLLGALFILGAKEMVVQTMNISGEAKEYLGSMTYVMAYFVLAQAFNAVMVVGIFRAGGDSIFGFFLDLTTMWLGSILLGILAAYVLHLPVIVVYGIIMSDELIKIPICIWRYKSMKWVRNITR